MLAIRLISPQAARGLIEYLTEQVAAAAGHGVSPMTRYFKADGQPPGRWLGAGLAGVDVVADWTVSATQLERLFQDGTHPRTGTGLAAHAYVAHETLEERVATEVAKLPEAMAPQDRVDAEAAIVAEQQARRQRASVSGFELVFSPPKSFSVAWGLGDVALKEQLSAAHDEALAETIGIMEDRYLRTRVGTNGVAQVRTRGAVAARFDHWNSRALDPHLHTHVLVANRVQGEDGRWRTVDSRGALMPAAVTLSETYTALLMDRVTQRLGWAWSDTNAAEPALEREFEEEVAQARSSKWELNGVPVALVTAFSQRSLGIQDRVDSLVESFRAERGRSPRPSELLRLRERARRDTAPAKEVVSLELLSAMWQERARTLGVGLGWLEELRDRGRDVVESLPRALARGDDVHPKHIEWVINGALLALRDRSTWRRHNVAAEAQRLLRDVRFASSSDRQAAVDLVVEEVVSRAVPLSPPARFPTPVQFQSPDGFTAFSPAMVQMFTTTDVLEAEERIIGALDTSPSCPAALVDTVSLSSGQLDAGQVAAVLAIATSRRPLDVLVGPAGTGKTTTLRELRAVWERQHGPGSVTGLAPSAAAAAVLAQSLEISTENTAKWLFENDRGAAGWSFHAGQLVIVDEASLAGTIAIDRLQEQAVAAGAKLLLVGDPAQMAAVDAGGGLELVVSHLGETAPTLDRVWRFRAEWESAASLGLRVGRIDVLDEYEQQGRLHSGDQETALDAAYAAWSRDESSGLHSILVADTREVMNDLNRRAQARQIEGGAVGGRRTFEISGGLVAYRGDRVLTRANDRRLVTARGAFVKNGQAWTVAEVYHDGSIALRDDTGDTIVVGADYAGRAIDLGYAVTAHRAQGLTVDTSHVIVSESTPRESFYVGMTRGRVTNHAYAVVQHPDEDDPSWSPTLSGREILEQVLARRGGDVSATTTRASLAASAASIAQLAAEYETISSSASSQLWRSRLPELGIPDHLVGAIVDSNAWASAVALLRDAAGGGVALEEVVPALIASRGFEDAADPGSVLQFRLSRWLHAQKQTIRPERIVGLLQRTSPEGLPADVVDALAAREDAILERASELVDVALSTSGSWIGELREVTTEQRAAAFTVAAFRDRHGVTDLSRPGLGTGIPSGSAARTEWALASAAWTSLTEPESPNDERDRRGAPAVDEAQRTVERGM